MLVGRSFYHLLFFCQLRNKMFRNASRGLHNFVCPVTVRPEVLFGVFLLTDVLHDLSNNEFGFSFIRSGFV